MDPAIVNIHLRASTDHKFALWLEDSASSAEEASHGPHDPRGFKENRHADHYESGRNNEQHHKARPFHALLPDAVRKEGFQPRSSISLTESQ